MAKDSAQRIGPLRGERQGIIGDPRESLVVSERYGRGAKRENRGKKIITTPQTNIRGEQCPNNLNRKCAEVSRRNQKYRNDNHRKLGCFRGELLKTLGSRRTLLLREQLC